MSKGNFSRGLKFVLYKVLAMKKGLFGKIKTYLLIILSVALIITGVQLYQSKQESQRQFESFLNQFYSKLEAARRSLDSVLEHELEGNDLEQALLQVEKNLEQTDLVLDAGGHFVDREIFSHMSIFAYHPINQFADNSTLTDAELRYLQNLKKDLETIQNGLYSNETGQENRNLSVQHFNDIIRGSGLESGFLTEQKSIPVHFQVIDPKQAPDRLQKWLERNETEEQNKVFLVDDKTYVVIVAGHRQDGLNQVEITDMVLKRGGIDVNHQNVESDDTKQEYSVTIAELEETERSFQFTTSEEIDEGKESPENTQQTSASVITDTQQTSASAITELVRPEKLSKQGNIIHE
jgi:hypothetical protein